MIASLTFGFGLTSLGCAATNRQLLRQPIKQQVAIVVRISKEVNLADESGGVAELVEAVSNGLKEHGMMSEIYTDPDDHPPAPRIELNVLYWSERTSNAKTLALLGSLIWPLGIASLGAGPSNRMVVDCAVFLDATGRAAYSKRIDTGPGLRMGDVDEAAAGDEAGSILMRELLNPEPKRQTGADGYSAL